MTGYTSASFLDSGGPYWVNTGMGFGKEDRITLVAIHKATTGSLKDEAQASLLTDPYYQCRMEAVKVSRQIVWWIKQKAGIPTHVIEH